MSDVVSQESRHAFRIYAKRGVQIERGKDVWLWDNAGKQYLDCMSGHGVMNVGHGNPVIIDALKTQLDRLVSCPGVFDNDVRGAYMARLVLEAPTHLSRVFLCNSGTESIEAALKFARFHTGRTGIGN